MHTHGPKRIYSPQSLEWWFERLDEEWEKHFPTEVLELGRTIYRDSQIREVELGASDAIIHRRIEKKEDYTVIEWADGKPSVRSSSTDEQVAQATDDQFTQLAGRLRGRGEGVTGELVVTSLGAFSPLVVPALAAIAEVNPTVPVIETSARSGEGVEDLLDALLGVGA